MIMMMIVVTGLRRKNTKAKGTVAVVIIMIW